ncbi:MAG: c-type cytochrome [Burkholderiales bacterium]|jgi:cytochrome c553|nr:c-type cytochrome [Burkholderiales bacterium]
MRTISAIGIFAIAVAPAFAQAPTTAQARDMAATCANCHGTNGVSSGGTDSLAGVPKAETARKMREYKAGNRPSTVMQQLAKGFTDEQIDAMAAWFAAQPAK